MKAIMISDHAKWCALMMNGDKTIEVRAGTALYKAIQKLIAKYGYADIFVYCSKIQRKHYHLIESIDTDTGKTEYEVDYYIGSGDYLDYCYDGKVSFKFRCYKVEEIRRFILSFCDDALYRTSEIDFDDFEKKSCLNKRELNDYLQGKPSTAIHISDLEIFDKPKELSEFKKYNDIDLHNHICLNCPHHYFDESGTPIESCCDLKWRCDRNYLTKSPQSFCYVEVE